MGNRHKFYNGILLLDKPCGITSHDAVAKVRHAVMQRRVGHTGTLDPRATGLLVVCMGRGTKIARFLTDMGKVYEAEVRLGQRSRTFDSEGVYEDEMPMLAPDMTAAEAQVFLDRYLGVTQQQVPAYSAVRVDGQRLYDMAREGIEVEPPIREIEIKEISLIKYEKPNLSFRISCSKGTYIRSLANDIGKDLGCGAYLSQLRRSSVGALSIDSAISIDEVERYHANGTLTKHLLSYDRVLPFSAFRIDNDFRKLVLSGRDVRVKDVIKVEGTFAAGDTISMKDASGQVLAVGTADADSDAFRDKDGKSKLFTYVRVLN